MEQLGNRGEGQPVVVFLPGAGEIGRDFWSLHRRAAEFSRSVIYDRAGTGEGAPAELPRTSTEATDELRALLRDAGIAGPYLFVGHSLGGLYARHYAIRFPAEVWALLFLDPAHEGYSASMPEELRRRSESFNVAEAAAAFEHVPEPVVQCYRSLFATELASWPAGVREPLIEYHVSPRALKVGLLEASNLHQLYAEIRTAGPLPDVPVVILCSMLVDPFKAALSQGVPDSLLREEIDGQWRLYNQFAASLPRGEVRPVEAGHATIHLRGEEAVVKALADLFQGG